MRLMRTQSGTPAWMTLLIVPMVALASIGRLAGYVTEPLLSDAEIHAIAGEPARLTPASIGVGPLKIVTWNIERGVRLQKIVTTLKALDPDRIGDVFGPDELERDQAAHQGVFRKKDLAHTALTQLPNHSIAGMVV